MSYLLDTCILSNLRKLKHIPNKDLAGWVSQHSETLYYISALSIGEIQKGIQLLNFDQARKKNQLEEWLYADLIPRFEGRILPINEKVATTWGNITASCKQKGYPLPAIDGLLAATAIHYSLILVTDNVRDFESSGVPIINPCVPYAIK